MAFTLRNSVLYSLTRRLLDTVLIPTALLNALGIPVKSSVATARRVSASVILTDY